MSVFVIVINLSKKSRPTLALALAMGKRFRGGATAGRRRAKGGEEDKGLKTSSHGKSS
jgi:hypothetical protein